VAGVGSALAWGIADYAGGIVSRRIPALWTSIGMQLVGTVVFIFALLLLDRWPRLDPGILPWGIGLAALGAVSLLMLYRGLALGPIAVVSPVVAGYTAVTILILVVFLGERVTPAVAIAIGVTFAGVLLASTDLRHVATLIGKPLRGVPSGLVAMAGFGAWGALMALALRSHDQLALILVGRIAGFAIMLLIALALRVGPPADRRPGTLALIVTVGLFDTVANVLFVAGLAAGEATIVATASGLYPVLPALLAIVFLGERLALSQYVGVAVLVAGLLAIGVLR